MTLLTEIKNRSLVITLNRPKERNALNAVLIQALQSTLTMHQDDANIRTIILQGAGEHFCAGADIKHMQHLMQASHDDNVQDAKQLAELLWQLYSYPKPVITLCHGATLGGGIGLLAASDIVLSKAHATFSFSEVKLGIIPAIISPYVLRVIGMRAMHRYVLTGERFDAEKALRLGLVHTIVLDMNPLDRALIMADMIAHNSPSAITAAKKLMLTLDAQPLDYAHATAMAEQLASIRQTNEAQEGFNAFIEKRLPDWR